MAADKGSGDSSEKSGRVASEGLVAFSVDGTTGAVVELNAETDFVARNTEFQEFASTLASLSLSADDIDGLSGLDYPGTGRNVAEELTHKIATIGENMSLRRMAKLSVNSGAIVSYLHNATAPGRRLVFWSHLNQPTRVFWKVWQTDRRIAATSPASLSIEDWMRPLPVSVKC